MTVISVAKVVHAQYWHIYGIGEHHTGMHTMRTHECTQSTCDQLSESCSLSVAHGGRPVLILAFGENSKVWESWESAGEGREEV